jgi:hypothetical protein
MVFLGPVSTPFPLVGGRGACYKEGIGEPSAHSTTTRHTRRSPMSSGGGPAAGTPVFAIGSLDSNGDPMGCRLIFSNHGGAPTAAGAIQAVEQDFRLNFAKRHPGLTNPQFTPYTAPDGSVLVEVSDGRGFFACTIALYKIVPAHFAGAAPAP